MLPLAAVGTRTSRRDANANTLPENPKKQTKEKSTNPSLSFVGWLAGSSVGEIEKPGGGRAKTVEAEGVVPRLVGWAELARRRSPLSRRLLDRIPNRLGPGFAIIDVCSSFYVGR